MTLTRGRAAARAGLPVPAARRPAAARAGLPVPAARRLAAACALGLAAAVAGCAGEPLAPLPVRTAPPSVSGAPAPVAAPGRSVATTPAGPSRPARTTTPPRPGTATTTTTATPPPSASASSACLGAVRYDLDLRETVLDLITSMCFRAGGVLRLQGIGPGQVASEPDGLTAHSYEAGVQDVRFLRPGTVTVTIPQDDRTHTITVVVIS